MDSASKFIVMLVIIFIISVFGGLLIGAEAGKKMHSGFCPKCNRWYNDQYYYCQDDGEKLLRPAEP